jgi:hypothetical protein
MRWLACVVACIGCERVFLGDPLGAARDGGEAIPSFCAALAQPYVMCADFDTPATDLHELDPTLQLLPPNSVVENATGDNVSPPEAMHAYITSSSGNGVAYAHYKITVPSYAGTIDFDVKVVNPTACAPRVAEVDFASSIVFSVDTTPSGLTPNLVGNGCAMAGQTFTADMTHWSHVTIGLNDISRGNITFSIGSSTEQQLGCPMWPANGQPVLQLGAYTLDASGDCETRIDNVVVR